MYQKTGVGIFGYLLQETGSHIELEDGSGALLLEI